MNEGQNKREIEVLEDIQEIKSKIINIPYSRKGDRIFVENEVAEFLLANGLAKEVREQERTTENHSANISRTSPEHLNDAKNANSEHQRTSPEHLPNISRTSPEHLNFTTKTDQTTLDQVLNNFILSINQMFLEKEAKDYRISIEDAKAIAAKMAKWRMYLYTLSAQDLAFLLDMNSTTLRKYLSYLQKCDIIENETIEATQKKIRGRYRLKLGLGSAYNEIDGELNKAITTLIKNDEIVEAIEDYIWGLTDIVVVDISGLGDERMSFEILGKGSSEEVKKEYRDMIIGEISNVYSNAYNFNIYAIEDKIDFIGEGQETESGKNMKVKRNIGRAIKIRGAVIDILTRSVPLWIDFEDEKEGMEYRYFLNGYEKIQLSLGGEIKRIKPPFRGDWKQEEPVFGDVTVVKIQAKDSTIINTVLSANIDVEKYKGQMCEATIVPNTQLQSEAGKETIQDWYDLKNLKSLERARKVEPDREKALKSFCSFYLGAEDVKEIIFDAYMYYNEDHFRETIIPFILYAQSGEGKTKLLEEIARQFDCIIFKPNSLSGTATGYIRKIGNNDFVEVRPPDQPFILADELDKMEPDELKALLVASGGERSAKVRYGQSMASYMKGVPVFTILENYQELLKERRSLGRRQYILQIVRRCINLRLPKSQSRSERVRDHLEIVLQGKEDISTDYIDAVKERAENIKRKAGFDTSRGLYRLECYESELRNYQGYLGGFIENIDLGSGVEYDLTLDMLIIKLATGHAFSFGRDYVVMDDIKYISSIIQRHAEALGIWKGSKKKVYDLDVQQYGFCDECKEEKNLSWSTIDGRYLCDDCAKKYQDTDNEKVVAIDSWIKPSKSSGVEQCKDSDIWEDGICEWCSRHTAVKPINGTYTCKKCQEDKSISGGGG